MAKDAVQCPCCLEADLGDDFNLMCYICPNCNLHMSWSGYELEKKGWLAQQRKNWKRRNVRKN